MVNTVVIVSKDISATCTVHQK